MIPTFIASNDPSVIDFDDYHYENYAIIPEYVIKYDEVEIIESFPFTYYSFDDGGEYGLYVYFELFLKKRGFKPTEGISVPWGDIFTLDGEKVGYYSMDGVKDDTHASKFKILPIVDQAEEFAKFHF